MVNSKSAQKDTIKVYTEETTISHQNTIPMLGITLNHKLNFTEHLNTNIYNTKGKLIKALRTSPKKKLALLKYSKRYLSTSNVKTLNQSLFNGKLMYGLEIWGSVMKTDAEKVEKLREKAFRLTFGKAKTALLDRKQLFDLMGWDELNILVEKNNSQEDSQSSNDQKAS